jgi:hypothetical protein
MKAMNDSIISVHNAIMMIPAPPPSAYAEFMPRSLNLGNLVTDVEAIRNKVAGSRDY